MAGRFWPLYMPGTDTEESGVRGGRRRDATALKDFEHVLAYSLK
jgi:hypothetical protein